MLERFCKNCGAAKPISSYSSYYCPECETTKLEATEYALKENLDPVAVSRAALAARVKHPQSGSESNQYFDRIRTSEWEKRLSIEPGSADDPRRS